MCLFIYYEEIDNLQISRSRISHIFIIAYANIVCHAGSLDLAQVIGDTTIVRIIIQVMRHCPMTRELSWRHNTAALRYNVRRIWVQHCNPIIYHGAPERSSSHKVSFMNSEINFPCRQLYWLRNPVAIFYNSRH